MTGGDIDVGVQLRAVFLTFIMIMSVFGVTMAFSGTATAQTDIITVDDDGNADYSTISAAVDNATDGATIEVAAGTYDESVTIDKSLTLEGAGAGSTTIVGAGENAQGESQPFAAIHVNDGSGPVRNVIIEGFTVRNPNGKFGIFAGTGSTNSAPDGIGGLVIRDNVIQDISTKSSGRALTGGPAGIGIRGDYGTDGNPGIEISNNNIHNVENTGGGPEPVGITLKSFTGDAGFGFDSNGNKKNDPSSPPATDTDIRNNEISNIASNGGFATKGISVSGEFKNVDIINNQLNTIESPGGDARAITLSENGGSYSANEYDIDGDGEGERIGPQDFEIRGNTISNVNAKDARSVNVGGYEQLDPHSVSQNTINDGAVTRFAGKQPGFQRGDGDALNPSGNTFTDQNTAVYYSDGSAAADLDAVFKNNDFSQVDAVVGDTTITPTVIANVMLSNPSGNNLIVSVTTTEEISSLVVNLGGPTATTGFDVTLADNEFTESSNEDGTFSYEAIVIADVVGEIITYQAIVTSVDGNDDPAGVRPRSQRLSVSAATPAKLQLTAEQETVRVNESIELTVRDAESDTPIQASINLPTQNVQTDPDGTVNVSFEAAGDVRLRATAPGFESDTLTLTVEETPADFRVSNVSPDGTEVTAGDNITVSADIENIGGQQGTQTVEFRIVSANQGGSIENAPETETQELSLDAGASQTITFENISTSGLDAGEFTHGVFSANDSATGTLTVGGNGTGGGDVFTEPIISGGQTPEDTNGDGQFEDVNGDGTADFDDAVDLAFADTSQLSDQQRTALDFNGDGDVDFDDAVELAFQN